MEAQLSSADSPGKGIREQLESHPSLGQVVICQAVYKRSGSRDTSAEWGVKPCNHVFTFAANSFVCTTIICVVIPPLVFWKLHGASQLIQNI